MKINFILISMQLQPLTNNKECFNFYHSCCLLPTSTVRHCISSLSMSTVCVSVKGVCQSLLSMSVSFVCVSVNSLCFHLLFMSVSTSLCFTILLLSLVFPLKLPQPMKLVLRNKHSACSWLEMDVARVTKRTLDPCHWLPSLC